MDRALTGHWAGWEGVKNAVDWAGRKLYITACEIQYTTSLSRWTVITSTSQTQLRRLSVNKETCKLRKGSLGGKYGKHSENISCTSTVNTTTIVFA